MAENVQEGMRPPEMTAGEQHDVSFGSSVRPDEVEASQAADKAAVQEKKQGQGGGLVATFKKIFGRG